jgi:antitoxin component YwqK of YwqJK toxin-antitoxin module
VESDENWKDGNPNGMVIHYFDNGQKKKEGNWDNGKKHGIFREWDERGNLIKEENFDNDSLVKLKK